MSRALNISDAKVSLDGGKTFHDVKLTEIRYSEKDTVYKHDLKIPKETTFSGTFTVKIPAKIRTIFLKWTIFRKWIDMILKETNYERLN